jgi:hypothetical protein
MAQELPLFELSQEIANRFAPQPAPPPPTPPPPQFGFFGNLARGLKRGVAVNLPELAGQILEAPGQPGDTLYDTGAGIRAAAQARGALPQYQVDPNSLVSAGAEQLPTVLGGAGLVLGGTALAGLAGVPAAVGAGVAGGALAAGFGAGTFQDTFERAKAAGLSDTEAHNLGMATGAIVGGVTAASGGVASRLLRGAASPFIKNTFESGVKNWVAPSFIKPLAANLAEQAVTQPALMAGQAAAQAAVEREGGIPGSSPAEAAESTVLPTLSMVGLMTPFAAMGVGLNNRAKRNAVATVSAPSEPGDANRIKLANMIGKDLSTIDPKKGMEWREAALEAINQGRPVDVDPAFAAWWTNDRTVGGMKALQPSPYPALPAPWQLAPHPDAVPAQTMEDVVAQTVQERNARPKLPAPGQTLAISLPDQRVFEPEVLPMPQRSTAADYMASIIGPPEPTAEFMTNRERLAAVQRAATVEEPQTAMEAAFERAQNETKQREIEAAYKELQDTQTAQKQGDLTSIQIAGLMQRAAEARRRLGELLATKAEEQPGLTTINAPADPDIALGKMRDLIKENDLGRVPKRAFDQVEEALQQKSRQAQLRALEGILKERNPTTNTYAAIDSLYRYMRGEENEGTPDSGTGPSGGGETPPGTPKGTESGRTPRETAAPIPGAPEQRDEGNASPSAAAAANEKGARIGEKVAETSTTEEELVGNPVINRPAEEARQPDFWHQYVKYNPNQTETNPNNRMVLVSYAEALHMLGNAEGNPDVKRVAELMNFGGPETVTKADRERALQSFSGWTAANHKYYTDALHRYVDAVDKNLTMRQVAKAKETSQNIEFQQQLAKQNEADRAARLLNAVRKGPGGYPVDEDLINHIAANNGDAHAGATVLATQAPTETLRDVNAAVVKRQLKTSVKVDPSVTGGFYDPETDTIVLGTGGQNPITLTHELVHAASHGSIVRGLTALDAIAAGEKTLSSFTPQERVEIAATNRLQTLFNEFTRATDINNKTAEYALKDIHEFFSEGLSNPAVQEMLGGRSAWWRRFVNVVADFLGLPAKRTQLEEMLRLAPALFGAPDRTLPKLYGPSPPFSLKGLANVTGDLGRKQDKLGVAMEKYKWPLSKAWFYLTSLNHQAQVLASRITDWAKKYPALEPGMKEVHGSIMQAYIGLRQRAGLHSELTMGYQLGKDMLALQRKNAKLIDATGIMATEGSRLTIDPRKSFEQVQADMVKEKGRPLTLAEQGRLNSVHNSLAAQKVRAEYQRLVGISEQMARQAKPGEKIITPMSIYHNMVVQHQLNYSREMANRTRDILKTFGAEADPRFADVSKRLDMMALMHQNNGKVSNEDQLKALVKAIGDARTLAGEWHSGRMKDVATKFGVPTKKGGGELTIDDWISHLTKLAADKPEAEKQSIEGVKANIRESSNLQLALQDLNKHFHGRLSVPYFHLGRAGQYMARFTVAPDAEGSTTHWDEVGKIVGGDKNAGGLERAWGEPSGGNRDVYMRFEDPQMHGEAISRLRPLIAAGHVVPDSFEVGRIGDNKFGINTATPLFIKLQAERIANMPGLTSEQITNLQSDLYNTYLATLPETSALKANIFRDGDLGYSTDFIQTQIQRQEMAHSSIAATYTRPIIAEAMTRATDAMKELRKLAAKEEGAHEVANDMSLFHDELSARLKMLQTPVSSPVFDRARAITAFWFLAGSPAYLMMNAYQPWQVSMPFLGGTYGWMNSAKAMMTHGTPKAFGIVHQAMKAGWGQESGVWDKINNVSSAWIDFSKLVKKDGKTPLLSPEEIDAGERLQWSGLLSFGLTNQIARMNADELGWVEKTTRISSIFSHYVEVTNRLNTFYTAYELAKNPPNKVTPMNHEAAVQYAMQAVRNFDMDHSQTNIARGLGRQGFAGPATPLLVGFQQYNIQMMEMLGRTLASSFKTGEEAKAARKALAGMSVMTAVMAGTLGLPFVGAFAALAQGLASPFDDNEPFDAQASYRRIVSQIFGKEMGEIVARGLPRAFDIDMSQRSGFQDMLPFTQFLLDRRKIEDQIADGALETLGPAFGTVGSLWAGLHAVHDKDVPKVINDMLPVSVRNWARAYYLANHGFEAGGMGHNQIPIGIGGTNEASMWQILQQAGGLTSGTKAEYQEKNLAFSNRQIMLQRRKQVIDSQLYKAFDQHDFEKMGELWREALEFNVRNPVQPITSQQIAQGIKARKEAQAVGFTSGTGILASPKLAPELPRFNW